MKDMLLLALDKCRRVVVQPANTTLRHKNFLALELNLLLNILCTYILIIKGRLGSPLFIPFVQNVMKKDTKHKKRRERDGELLACQLRGE